MCMVKWNSFLSLSGMAVASLVLSLCLGVGALNAREKKDMILVLDTSLSMAGCGGKNVFPEVKKSLEKFIDQLDEGDSITFVAFDSDVRVYPTVFVHDANDRDIIKKYVSVVNAKGDWTYTQGMIKSVLKIAQSLEEKDRSRQRVIVVLTDAIDDPPPDRVKQRFNIKEIATQYSNKDWFIFFVNLGEKRKDSKIEKVQKELKESVSRYTKVVNAADAPAKVIEKDLIGNVEKMEAVRDEREKGFFSGPYFLAIIVVALLLLVIAIARRFVGLKLIGTVEYWNHTVLEPYIKAVDLAKIGVRKITIGRGGSNNLNIRDIEIPEPFKISAVRVKGKPRCALQWGNAYTIDMVDRATADYLSDGDVFKVANYTFRYIETPGKMRGGNI